MIIQFIFSVLSVVAFCLIFNVRGKIGVYASLVGGTGWIVYLLATKMGFSVGVGYFLAAAIATFGSEVIARKLRTPVTSSLIPVFTPLVPGGGVYYTMFYIFNGDYERGLEKGVETFIVSIAITLGFLVVTEGFKIYGKHRNKYIQRSFNEKN